MTTRSPRQDIQGLRGLAVLAVVIFHAGGGAWLQGGFLGVDVFFVISGFLITGLLLRAHEFGGLSLTDFYRRRVRRLFPALFVMLIATLVAGGLLLPPAAYEQLGAATMATLLFASNLFFMGRANYFEPAVGYNPLLHTWSLAVEEQFYILFPVGLLLLWRTGRLGRRGIGIILTVAAGASLGLGLWMSAALPTKAFYFTPGRAFELLVGAVAACFPGSLSGLGRRWRDGLSLIGLGLILLSFLLIGSEAVIPGIIALVPCVGAAIILHGGQDSPSLAGRLISLPPLVVAGDISYSLYLWHWPLLAFAREWALGPLSSAMAGLVVLASLIVAYGSWRWIEQPALRTSSSPRVFSLAAASMLAIAAACALLSAFDGLPGRFDGASQALFAAAQDNNHSRSRCHSDEGAPIPYAANCVFGATGAEPSVAIWSDSHGAELAVALGDRARRSGGSVMQITASLCPPAVDYRPPSRPACAGHNTETLVRLTTDRRIDTVVMLANFGVYPEDMRPAFLKGFERSVLALARSGKHVVIFEPIPVFAHDVPTALGAIRARGGDPAAWGQDLIRYRSRNAPFLAELARLGGVPGVRVVKTSALLCREGFCPAYAPGEGVLYFNADHVSVTGARRLAAAVPLIRGQETTREAPRP